MWNSALKDSKGIALLVVIIIIVVAAIIVFGIASFISSGLTLNIARASMERAVAAAQAGILAAINDYLIAPSQPYWVKAASVNTIGNAYYSIGKDANFLLIDADDPQISTDTIGRIPLTNINQTQAITANRMMVEWYNLSGATLNEVRVGDRRRWRGTADSGQIIILSPQFALNAQQSFSDVTSNSWRFSTNIPNNAIIMVTFYFTDGSSRKAYLLNNGRSGNKEFSVTATGELRGTTTWKRTIEATYDVGVNRITSWQETEGHI